MRWFSSKEHPEEDLSAYLDGELSDRERRKVEGHLAACDRCSSLLEELASMRTMLSTLPEVEPRRSFVLGPEHARPRPGPAAARQERRSPFVFAPAVALALLVALVGVDLAAYSGGNSGGRADQLASGAAELREAVDEGTLQRTAEQPVPANSGAGASAGAAENPPADRSTGPDQRVPMVAPGTAPEGAPTAPTPSEGAAFTAPGQPADTDAAGVASSVEPERQAGSQSSGTPSTLRVLQVLAAIAFAVSLLWLAVRPRLASEGD